MEVSNLIVRDPEGNNRVLERRNMGKRTGEMNRQR